MAVNETARDHLRLQHICDQIDNIIGGLTAENETADEKKNNVGNMVMMLEAELLDDRWSSLDTSRWSSAIATGRRYWKG